MKYAVAAVLAILLSLGIVLATSKPVPAVASSTVLVSDEGGHGSGVHIGSGFILTAAHVVEGHDSITITDSRGNVQFGVVLWANKTYDVALIHVDAAGLRASTLDCRHIFRVGDKITARGHPGDLRFVTTWGHISAPVTQYGPWKMAFLADISIGPGMSGGPVFDELGRVIGLTVGVSIANLGFVPSIYGESFVVPSSAVCLLLAEARK